LGGSILGEFTIENCDLTMQNGGFTKENGDLSCKNGGLIDLTNIWGCTFPPTSIDPTN